uniref:Uncharacterized protein n=1 Tax=Meloidogyne incognita TaxID=6306 RepID=A0A914NHN1_MELIC
MGKMNNKLFKNFLQKNGGMGKKLVMILWRRKMERKKNVVTTEVLPPKNIQNQLTAL